MLKCISYAQEAMSQLSYLTSRFWLDLREEAAAGSYRRVVLVMFYGIEYMLAHDGLIESCGVATQIFGYERWK